MREQSSTIRKEKKSRICSLFQDMNARKSMCQKGTSKFSLDHTGRQLKPLYKFSMWRTNHLAKLQQKLIITFTEKNDSHSCKH